VGDHNPRRPAPLLANATLPVVETFHSVQGEGHHVGRSAFFIRLAGCSVGCPWCDTRHSWPVDGHPRQPLSDLTEQARQASATGAAFAVITGGEPLEHDLAPVCASLAAVVPQLPLHLETSGAAPLALSGRFDWITLSPKRHRPPSAALLAACAELKVVVHEPADLAFAETMADQARRARQQHGGDSSDPAHTGPRLLLQPGWNCRRGQELALAFVHHHPLWRLSLQTHKWLGVR
jgi:7-carboxy-7-deazaguanine synthase